jgi:hypothetical protein
VGGAGRSLHWYLWSMLLSDEEASIEKKHCEAANSWHCPLYPSLSSSPLTRNCPVCSTVGPLSPGRKALWILSPLGQEERVFLANSRSSKGTTRPRLTVKLLPSTIHDSVLARPISGVHRSLVLHFGSTLAAAIHVRVPS